MPNIINLRLLNNKNIVAELDGIPLAQENSYKIIAGEENATIFKIISKPFLYKDARYTVEMVNSQGYGVSETDIIEDTFALPIGMAVAGYGYVQLRAYLTNAEGKQEVVPFMVLKVKVWNTIPEWKDHIDEGGGEGGNIVVDSELSPTSTNPLQNRVIYGIVENVRDTFETVNRKTKSNADAWLVGAKALEKTEGYKFLNGDDAGAHNLVEDRWGLSNKLYVFIFSHFITNPDLNDNDYVVDVELYGVETGSITLFQMTKKEFETTDTLPTITIDNTDGVYSSVIFNFGIEKGAWAFARLEEKTNYIEISDALLGG